MYKVYLAISHNLLYTGNNLHEVISNFLIPIYFKYSNLSKLTFKDYYKALYGMFTICKHK